MHESIMTVALMLPKSSDSAHPYTYLLAMPIDVDLDALKRAARFTPGMHLVTWKGVGCYSILRRYYRRSMGKVLYDLEVWAEKAGHKAARYYGVPEEELRRWGT